MRRFEFAEGSSRKFWEVAVDGSSLTVRFGRIDTEGQTQLKSFPTDEKAQSELEKLVREKQKKGYVELGVEATSDELESSAKQPAAPKAKKEKAAAPADEVSEVSGEKSVKSKGEKSVSPAKSKGGDLGAKSVQEAGWLEADKGYKLALKDGKVVCKNAKGQQLASVPKDIKEGEIGSQLADLRDWILAHDKECLETVETWMLRSLPTPREVLATVWTDPSWRAVLENTVVVPVDAQGERDESNAGFFRGVDLAKGIGIVNLDGETVWIDAPRVSIVHPILLGELDDFRALATELSITQNLPQLFRETFTKPTTLAEDLDCISDYQNANFEMLSHAFGRCRKFGYRVSAGWAICRIWVDGKVCEARFWLGDGDPFYETDTGDLVWVDDKQKQLTVMSVPPVAFSEGMRMASLVYAGRTVEGKEDSDA